MSAPNAKARAAYWVIRNQTAKHPERHWLEFEQWLAKDSPYHRRLYDAEERRWIAMSQLRPAALRHYGPTPKSLLRTMEEGRRERTRRAARAAVFVSCIGLPITGAWFGLGRNLVEPHPWVTYQRGTEQLTPVSLADGSVFQLNANSQVRVRLTETERQVALDDGEAYFDVNPNPKRPFDVTAGSVTVHTKGTAFDVRKEESGEVETAVRRGFVAVGPTDHAPTPVGTSQSTLPEVKAGQVATIGPSGEVSVKEADAAELTERLAWANPYYRFDGMTLADAVALFNRYNVRKLEVSGPALGQVQITGRFRLTEPDLFVESLQRFGIDHVMQGLESRPDARIVLVRK